MSRLRHPDRVITDPDERLDAVLDVIRQARERIELSLFRANEKAVFDELARAVERGVDVEVLVTSRAKGGKKKMKKLWRALEATGATMYAYTDPVVKYHAKYLIADDGPGARLVAELHAEMLQQDLRRHRHHSRPGGRLGPAASDERRSLRAADSRRFAGSHRPGPRARAAAAHLARRRGAFEHPPD
jgi:hypothetical protein